MWSERAKRGQVYTAYVCRTSERSWSPANAGISRFAYVLRRFAFDPLRPEDR